jgi:hypothetical protein
MKQISFDVRQRRDLQARHSRDQVVYAANASRLEARDSRPAQQIASAQPQPAMQLVGPSSFICHSVRRIDAGR